MSQVSFTTSLPCCSYVIPNNVLQEIAAQVGSLKDLVSLGRTCRALSEAALGPQAKSWKVLNEKYCIHLSEKETPKEGVKRFFGQFVDSFFTLARTILVAPNELQMMIDQLEKVKSMQTLSKRFIKCLSLLPGFKTAILLETMMKGHADCTEFALKKEGYRFSENAGSQGIFNMSARGGHLHVLQRIHSIDQNFFKLNFQKPFLFAVEEGHLSTIDFFFRNVSCEAVLTKAKIIALAQGRLDIFKLFLRGQEPSRLLYAISKGDRKEVETFVTGTSETERFFAYYFALGIRNFELMEILFDPKFIINKAFDEVFFAVVRQGDAKMTRHLITKIRQYNKIESGPNGDCIMTPKITWYMNLIISAIHEASRKGHRSLIKNELLIHIGQIVKTETVILAGNYGISEIIDFCGATLATMPKEALFSTAMNALKGGHLNVLEKISVYLAGYEKFSKLFLMAAAQGHLDCMRELLRVQPIDPETKTLAVALAHLGNFGRMERFLTKPELEGRVFFVFFKKL